MTDVKLTAGCCWVPSSGCELDRCGRDRWVYLYPESALRSIMKSCVVTAGYLLKAFGVEVIAGYCWVPPSDCVLELQRRRCGRDSGVGQGTAFRMRPAQSKETVTGYASSCECVSGSPVNRCGVTAWYFQKAS